MSKFRISTDYLPDSVVNPLSRKAQIILRVFTQIFNHRKEVIAYEYAHITPSLAYLSARCKLSRSQVSRGISELATANIIRRTQQRTESGEWRLLKIRLGQHFDSLWKAFKAKKFLNKIAGLHNSANIENKEPLEDNYYDEFCKFLKNIGSRGAQPAPA